LAVPHDEDGLILWSFAYYLTEIQNLVGEMDLPLDGLYPIRMAYAPDMGDDLNAYTNAAWACGDEAHLFVVLPDLFTEFVPVGAHQGVIRHEFGHTLFGHLASGISPACPEDPSMVPGNWALWNEANEGFADILATLTLDDPVFMESALPINSRDVRLDQHVASTELYLRGIEESDPYLVGSVLAAFAWDIREAVGPELPLQAALAASQRLRFLPDENPEEDLIIVVDVMALEMLHYLANTPDALTAACDAPGRPEQARSHTHCATPSWGNTLSTCFRAVGWTFAGASSPHAETSSAIAWNEAGHTGLLCGMLPIVSAAVLTVALGRPLWRL